MRTVSFATIVLTVLLSASPAFAACANERSIHAAYKNHVTKLNDLQARYNAMSAITGHLIATVGTTQSGLAVINANRDVLIALSAQIKDEKGLTFQASDLWESCVAQQ